MAKNWTNLSKKHQATLDYYCGPYDKTYGNDMQNEPTTGNDCPPLETPVLERNID